jgi:hypothetical protein
MKELSELSGCDRNVLSRIKNRPDIIPSANIIDKLAQFFFRELRGDDPAFHRGCMNNIINLLVSVYPDDTEFWKDIPPSLQNNKFVGAHDFWDIYSTIQEKRHEASNT